MIKKLPDAEFDVMKVVWANESPVLTSTIVEQLSKEKEWKARQTAISLLLRLVDRGFLRTEKNGKEREYYPIITKEEYLKFETRNFLSMYHENSFASFVSTLYDNADIHEEDVEAILKMAKEKGE